MVVSARSTVVVTSSMTVLIWVEVCVVMDLTVDVGMSRHEQAWEMAEDA